MNSQNKEKKRLEALKNYEILDTQAEQSYDDFTYLASRIFDTPISMISLIDESRQWFKSKVGVEVNETPRDWAICAKTIMHDDVLVVPDASNDERFSCSPLVKEDPKIRFYAGAPLKTPSGDNIGTICVIDNKPRKANLTEEQIKILQGLSRQIISQMELQKALRQVKTLKGLLPICAYCKNIRDESNYWQRVESYMSSHLEVEFSHSVCDQCKEKVLQELVTGGSY